MFRILCLASVLAIGLVAYVGLAGGWSQAQMQRTDTVYLNGAPVASLDRLAPLTEKLDSLRETTLRTSPMGSYRVNVKLAPSMPLSALAAIAHSIGEVYGEMYMSLADPETTPPVTARPAPAEPMVSTDAKASLIPDPAAFGVSAYVIDQARDLKLARVSMSSIEIDNSGQFFWVDRGKDYGTGMRPRVNANFGSYRRLDGYTVSRRKIEASEIEKAMVELVAVRRQETTVDHRNFTRRVGGRVDPGKDDEPLGLQIIAGEATPLSQLIPIFRAANAKVKDVSWTVAIRRASLSEAL